MISREQIAEAIWPGAWEPHDLEADEVTRTLDLLKTSLRETVEEMAKDAPSNATIAAFQWLETDYTELRAAVKAFDEAKDRQCGVCTGRSPAWDGHDANPACRQYAYDRMIEAAH